MLPTLLIGGIDPLADPFTLSLTDADGPFYTAVLPPGAFKVRDTGDFVFKDPSGIVAAGLRRVRLEPDGPGSVNVIAERQGLDLSGADRSAISIGIAIGNATGQDTVIFRHGAHRWLFP